MNKGADRPLIPDDLRAASVAALECVDWVYVNHDPTAVGLLDALRPDVYVKGREYEKNLDPRFLAERDAVTRHGGRVVFSSGDVVYSSTALIGAMGRADLFNDEKLARLRERYGLSTPRLESVLRRGAGQARGRGRRLHPRPLPLLRRDRRGRRRADAVAQGVAAEGLRRRRRASSPCTWPGWAPSRRW